MNSCTSTELSACAPPLMMFIIGHGQDAGADAAQVAIERRPLRGGGGARGGHGDGQDGVGAQACPCSACRRARSWRDRSRACWVASLPCSAAAISPLMWLDRLAACPCRGSAPCRRRAVPPLRARRWMRRMARRPVPCCRRRDKHPLPQSDSRGNPESLFQLLLRSSSNVLLLSSELQWIRPRPAEADPPAPTTLTPTTTMPPSVT